MTDIRKADFLAAAGAQAIGGRLRRLSDLIDGQTRQAYADQGIEFEQRWFGVLMQIIIHKTVSVSDIADALRISHVSVSQSCTSLIKAGLVNKVKDPNDKRRSILSLTDEGQDFSAKLRPLWDALNDVAVALDKEAGGVVDILARLETALTQTSIAERVKDLSQ